MNGYARFSSLLSPAMSSRAPGRIVWMLEISAEFSKLKLALCNHVMLYEPNVSDVFVVHTNASGLSLGGVLNIFCDNDVLPAVFFCRQLKDAEKRYLAMKLELQAVLATVVHYYHYLYGTRFTVITDHRPLTLIYTSKTLNKF